MEKYPRDKHAPDIKIWDEVFRGLDLSYSEDTKTQAKLFEYFKIDFLKEIYPPPPLTTLEVGCGTAYISLFFAKRGYLATCLDINPKILKIAQKNFTKEGIRAKFVLADASHLPFKNCQFDVVTSFGLLEHFHNPAPIINEMSRVLKKRGLFFADIVPKRFSCQSLGNMFNAFASFIYWSTRGKLHQAINKAKRNFQPLYFENDINFENYRKIMQSAGITNIHIRGNRPFPRLTLPTSIDQIYTRLLKLTLPAWKVFDRWDNNLARHWGAGLWFWGTKS